MRHLLYQLLIIPLFFSESFSFTADMYAWWLWHGILFDTNQNIWVSRTTGEQALYLNWLTPQNASTMAGHSDWYWGYTEPNALHENVEYCTFIGPTHGAGILNARCDLTSRVLCEYD